MMYIPLYLRIGCLAEQETLSLVFYIPSRKLSGSGTNLGKWQSAIRECHEQNTLLHSFIFLGNVYQWPFKII